MPPPETSTTTTTRSAAPRGKVTITLTNPNEAKEEKAKVTVTLNEPERMVERVVHQLARKFPPESVMTIDARAGDCDSQSTMTPTALNGAAQKEFRLIQEEVPSGSTPRTIQSYFISDELDVAIPILPSDVEVCLSSGATLQIDPSNVVTCIYGPNGFIESCQRGYFSEHALKHSGSSSRAPQVPSKPGIGHFVQQVVVNPDVFNRTVPICPGQDLVHLTDGDLYSIDHTSDVYAIFFSEKGLARFTAGRSSGGGSSSGSNDSSLFIGQMLHPGIPDSAHCPTAVVCGRNLGEDEVVPIALSAASRAITSLGSSHRVSLYDETGSFICQRTSTGGIMPPTMKRMTPPAARLRYVWIPAARLSRQQRPAQVIKIAPLGQPSLLADGRFADPCLPKDIDVILLDSSNSEIGAFVADRKPSLVIGNADDVGAYIPPYITAAAADRGNHHSPSRRQEIIASEDDDDDDIRGGNDESSSHHNGGGGGGGGGGGRQSSSSVTSLDLIRRSVPEHRSNQHRRNPAKVFKSDDMYDDHLYMTRDSSRSSRRDRGGDNDPPTTSRRHQHHRTEATTTTTTTSHNPNTSPMTSPATTTSTNRHKKRSGTTTTNLSKKEIIVMSSSCSSDTTSSSSSSSSADEGHRHQRHRRHTHQKDDTTATAAAAAHSHTSNVSRRQAYYKPAEIDYAIPLAPGQTHVKLINGEKLKVDVSRTFVVAYNMKGFPLFTIYPDGKRHRWAANESGVGIHVQDYFMDQELLYAVPITPTQTEVLVNDGSIIPVKDESIVTVFYDSSGRPAFNYGLPKTTTTSGGGGTTSSGRRRIRPGAVQNPGVAASVQYVWLIDCKDGTDEQFVVPVKGQQKKISDPLSKDGILTVDRDKLTTLFFDEDKIPIYTKLHDGTLVSNGLQPVVGGSGGDQQHLSSDHNIDSSSYQRVYNNNTSEDLTIIAAAAGGGGSDYHHSGGPLHDHTTTSPHHHPPSSTIPSLSSGCTKVIQRQVPVQKIEYRDKIVEVPEVHVVEKHVEVEKVEYVTKFVKKKQIVERPVEHVKYVPRIETKIVERVIEIPKVIEVERPEIIEQKISVDNFIDTKQEVVVSNKLIPQIVDTPEYDETIIECLRLEPELVAVDVYVPKLVRGKLKGLGLGKETRRSVDISLGHFNSLVLKLNQHLGENYERLPLLKISEGTYPMLNRDAKVNVHQPTDQEILQFLKQTGLITDDSQE